MVQYIIFNFNFEKNKKKISYQESENRYQENSQIHFEL
jgi:hypothetical protein